MKSQTGRKRDRDDVEQLYAVSVRTDAGVQIGAEQELPIDDFLNRSFHLSFDMFSNNEQFIAVFPDEVIRPEIYFVQNWFEELTQRVPVP